MNENAIKIDVFEFLRLMSRSEKNFLIRKNEFFFINCVLYKFCISCLIKTINQNLINNLTRIDKFNDKNDVNNYFKTKISK